MAILHWKQGLLCDKALSQSSNVIISVFAGLEQCPGNIQRNRNLRLYGSSCYEFVLSHPVDWGHADQDCKVKGGYLVDIHTREENYFIYRTLRVGQIEYMLPDFMVFNPLPHNATF